jgi:membrane-associated protease RseP (regulator of RpoE activity)
MSFCSYAGDEIGGLASNGPSALEEAPVENEFPSPEGAMVGTGREIMNRKFTTGLLLSALMLVVGVSDYRSQEAPEPPEPPDAPEAAMGGLESQLLALDGVAWLGITLKDVTADKARDLKLPGEYGALVESVAADSPAAKAGLQKGDVIVEFAGERVRSEAQLRRLIRETPAGRTVSLQVIRDGQARALNAKLLSRTNHLNIQVPEMHIAPPNPQLFGFGGYNFLFDGGRPSLGVSGDELTTQLASYFGVKQGKGVLVREVVVGSPAAKAGLKAGDVIVAVDGKSVATVTELRQALDIKPSKEEHKVNLTIVRDRHEQTVPVELERLGPGERGRMAANFGIDAGQLQRLEGQTKAQLAAARFALQDSQRLLSDQQRQALEKARHAAQEYRRAIQEQHKLQLEKQLYPLAGQNAVI